MVSIKLRSKKEELMNIRLTVILLFVIFAVIGCGNADTSEEYASRVEKLIDAGEFEAGQKLILEWAEAVPDDRKKIKPYQSKFIRAKRSAPAGAGGISQEKFNHLVAQASIDGDVAKIKELFMTNPNKKVEASQAGHPLLLAAAFGKTDVLSVLLNHGIDVNHQDGVGVTALMKAVMQQQVEAVQFLLNAGADVHLQTTGERKKSAISFVETSNNAAIKKMISDAAAKK